MNRLPAAVVSYLYSFLPLHTNIALASTCRRMHNTSKLPTSSPRKVVWKSSNNLSDNPNRIDKNLNDEVNKRTDISSWRMWPTAVYANNLEYDILPWFTTYPAPATAIAGGVKIRTSLLTHLALKINSAEQIPSLLVPALEMLVEGNNRNTVTENTTLKSLLIWAPTPTVKSDNRDYSPDSPDSDDYSNHLQLILPLLKNFTGIHTLGISGLTVAAVTHFPPSLTHLFLDTAPIIFEGMAAILLGWQSLARLPLQKLSLYLPRHQDYPNCAGENCYSGKLAEPTKQDNVDEAKEFRSRLQKFVWGQCDNCKLAAETKLYTSPSTSRYNSGVPTPPRNWTFNNNLANSLALHFSASCEDFVIEAYELRLSTTAPQIPRMTEFDCRVTSPTNLNHLMQNSGKQLQKLRLRGVRLKDSFINSDAFDHECKMGWVRYCTGITELIFTQQAVNDPAVTELFRCLKFYKSPDAKNQVNPLTSLDLSGNYFVGLGEGNRFSKKPETMQSFVLGSLQSLTNLRIVTQLKVGERDFLNSCQLSELRIPTLTKLELRTGSKLLPAGFKTFDSILDAFTNLTVWRAPRVVSLNTNFFAEIKSTSSSASSNSSLTSTSLSTHPLTHLDLGLVGKISAEQMAEIVKFIGRRLPLLVRLTIPIEVDNLPTVPPTQMTNQNGKRIIVIHKSPLVKVKHH